MSQGRIEIDTIGKTATVVFDDGAHDVVAGFTSSDTDIAYVSNDPGTWEVVGPGGESGPEQQQTVPANRLLGHVTPRAAGRCEISASLSALDGTDLDPSAYPPIAAVSIVVDDGGNLTTG